MAYWSWHIPDSKESSAALELEALESAVAAEVASVPDQADGTHARTLAQMHAQARTHVRTYACARSH